MKIIGILLSVILLSSVAQAYCESGSTEKSVIYECNQTSDSVTLDRVILDAEVEELDRREIKKYFSESAEEQLQACRRDINTQTMQIDGLSARCLCSGGETPVLYMELKECAGTGIRNVELMHFSIGSPLQRAEECQDARLYATSCELINQ